MRERKRKNSIRAFEGQKKYEQLKRFIMKTSRNQIAENRSTKGFPGKLVFIGIALFVTTLLGTQSFTAEAQRVSVNLNIELPPWAPFYNNAGLVRYYYLPDIECYYDVLNREFIYMEDGEWMFGRTLPPIYSWFDLYNCFIVALDARVFEPWRHFHYYVAHYPRFYYRTVYRDAYLNRERPMRGFDENERNIVYNRRRDMDGSGPMRGNDARREENNRSEPGRVINDRSENRQGGRQENATRRIFPERRVEATQPSQPVRYYGREVGRPVKVQRNMRHSEQIKVKGNRGVGHSRGR